MSWDSRALHDVDKKVWKERNRTGGLPCSSLRRSVAVNEGFSHMNHSVLHTALRVMFANG